MKTNTATLRIMMLEQPNKKGLYPIRPKFSDVGKEKRMGL